MKGFYVTSVSAFAMLAATPALAQTAQAGEGSYAADEIIVTAQRQAQSLQEVPIAVSAFSAEALEKQQIDNSSDLQLTLPNVTFSKGNFTGSSFTIRGIGDLCVGVSCDSATAIHLDGTPLLGTRLFETEFFDMERIEVLRGPQGTLFGRNATSGVVNFVPMRPDLTGFKASGEIEYGNYNSLKTKGMVNVALSDTLGVRVAGFYLKRDGYTENVFDGSKLDGRDMYSVRGSLRWQPTDSTTIDLMGSYFREKDNRLRIQKQLCQRDPTGVLGCLPNRLEYGTTNANSTFVGVLSSSEFLRVAGIPAAFGLGSLYGVDPYATAVNPANVRQVNTDYTPSYFTSEEQYQARIQQELGAVNLQLTGFYHKAAVDSSQDYNLSVQNRAGYAAALGTLQAAAAGLVPGLPASYFTGFANAVIPNGAAGNLCTSLAEETGTGSFGGHKLCSATPQDFDRSNQYSKDWSVEAIATTKFDGPFNFLLGGIYVDSKLSENSYYVNSFGIDYVTGVLGSFRALGGRLAPGYSGTPFFRNNTDFFQVKSKGLFGEAYFEPSEKFKLTVGLRYNNDKKYVRARSTLASFQVPNTATDAFATSFGGGFDADAATVCPSTDPFTGTQNTLVPGALGSIPGCEAFQIRSTGFSEMTGRVVADYKLSEDNLIYASYSRGYKSGGINPPLQPIFAVDESFKPEFVNAFEVGSKNVFANGKFVFNATAFYYQYKSLQLSRIVARTSVNDNVNANIYGLELESIIRPSRNWAFNLGASYLHTKVSQDKFLSNPRDPSGGRSDVVVVKDIFNGSNCAVVPKTAGNAAGTRALVSTVNSLLGLRAPTAFPSDSGIAAQGAFGICKTLEAASLGNMALFSPAFAAAQPLLNAVLNGGNAGPLPYTIEYAGVAQNIRGNKLPQAPNFKFSVGAQYTSELSNGMTVVPRVDLTYTGDSYGNIFNGRVNKVQGYAQANAQIQLNGQEDKWFVRGFVQNIFDSNSTTGLYVTDQSSGLYTNIFTLEPRRYGIAAGFKF